MIDVLVAGFVAAMAAALLYIGAHDLAGLTNAIIMDDALALAGLLAVALGGALLHDHQREQK
jgi:hypothetical protein